MYLFLLEAAAAPAITAAAALNKTKSNINTN